MLIVGVPAVVVNPPQPAAAVELAPAAAKDVVVVAHQPAAAVELAPAAAKDLVAEPQQPAAAVEAAEAVVVVDLQHDDASG
jgi:hypothetical protein